MLAGYWRLLQNSGSMVCFGLLTVFVGNFGQTFFISWYGADIQRALGLSATVYGAAYSAATLAGAVAIMFSGVVIDRMPLQRFVNLVGLGLVLAALLMWRVNSIATLLLALFLLRFCGQGLMPHTAMTAMGRYFSWNRGKAISIAGSGVPLGEILLPAVAVASIGLFGWQRSWLLVALVIPLVFLPVLQLLLRRAGPGEADADARTESQHDTIDGSRRTLLADARFWRASPLLLGPPFIITGLFIHQGFILAEKNWSAPLFASAFMVYGAMHWLASLMTGALVDRYAATSLLWLLGLPFALGLATGALLTGSWVSYLMMTALGLGLGMAGTIFNALWVEVYGTKNLGGIRSLATSLAILSASASPALLGFLIDRGMSAETMLLSMAAYIFSAMLLARWSY